MLGQHKNNPGAPTEPSGKLLLRWPNSGRAGGKLAWGESVPAEGRDFDLGVGKMFQQVGALGRRLEFGCDC